MMVGTHLLKSFNVDKDTWEYWKGYIIIRTIAKKNIIKTKKHGYFYRKTTDPCVRNNTNRDGTIFVLGYQPDEWAYIALGFCQSNTKPEEVTVLHKTDWL